MSYIYSGGSEVLNNASGASAMSGYMQGYLIAADTYETDKPFTRIMRTYGTDVKTENFVIESAGTMYANNGTHTNLMIYAGGSASISSSYINGGGVGGHFVASGATVTTATYLLNKKITGDNITVYSGGLLTVSSATLNNVTVSGNTVKWTGEAALAKMNVSGKGSVYGGSAVNAARVMVYSGGVVENMIFHASTYFYVSKNGLISGGEVHCANLEVRGGLVRGTLVNSGGLLQFTRAASGQTVSVTIGSRGSAYIGSGGTMTDTIISGAGTGSGVVIVSSGAAVKTTVMSLGTLTLRKTNAYIPTVTSTTLSKGGGLILSNGGVALSTTISSGGLAIVSGGVLSDTIQFDAGRASVYNGGTASGATLNSGAKLILYDGGSADAVTVNANGYLYAYSQGGALASATNIIENGGFAWGQGNTHGQMTFVANAFSDVVLNSNATLHSVTTGTNIDIYGNGETLMSCIFFGGSGYNLEAFSGGIIFVNSGHVSGAVAHSGGYINLAGNNNKTFMSGAFVESGASMTMKGGEVENVTISGAMVADDEDKTISEHARMYMYNGTLDSLTVIGVAGCYGTSAHADPEKRICAVVSGGSVTNVTIQNAGYVVVSNAGVSGVTMSKAPSAELSAWCYMKSGTEMVHSTMNTRLQVYSGGVVTDVKTLGGTCEVFVQAGGAVYDIDVTPGGYFGAYASGLISGGVASGYNASMPVRGGMVSGVTIRDRADMLISSGTAKGNNFISGANLRIGSKSTTAVVLCDSAFISGGYGEKIISSGKEKYNSVTTVNVSSGGKLTNSLIGDGTYVMARWGGTVSNTALLGLNTYDANTQDQNVMARLLVSGGGLWQGGDVLKHAQCLIYSGGSADGVTMGSGAHVYISANATATNMVVDGALDFGIRGGTAENTLLKKGHMTVSTGVASGTIISGGSLRTFTNGTADDTVMRGGLISVGAGTLNRTTVSNGGYLYAWGGVTLNDTVLSSGGSMRIFASGGAIVNGLTTEAGGNLVLDVIRMASGGALNIDSLENVNAPVTVVNYTTGNTYTLADVGNEDLEVNINYQGFNYVFGAGESYLSPIYDGRAFTLDAEGKTLSIATHNMSGTILTTEAADLATSGAFLTGYANSDDKAIMWADVNLNGAVTFATSAANIAGDAWIDLDRTKAAGGTIYGAEGNCMSDATIRYLVHGAGSVGNFAGGATAGGVVGGVELVGFNNTYGQTYLGGMGTVAGLVSARVSSGNTLSKDFYAGALANYAKTGVATTIGGIETTIALNTSAGTAKETKYYASGNIYGASQVKAGTVTNAATVHSVGDVVLTISNGEAAAANNAICIFAAGYATGHDEAKALPVYTVESVTATIAGGNWGGAHGGRGVFGGAFAGDNIADTEHGETAYGVWAQVGDVNLKVSGGTMGNVYGGGWAQKGAKSEVGNVNITVTGGTIANIFGGGSHSISGGTTVAGDVTITVSGGTITGDIYARGQVDGDATGAANVIFTGAKNFDCGVYGYTYVSGATETDDHVILSFSNYAGTFSGEIGGFNGITFDGNTTMVLGTAANDVTNGVWTFDTAERFTALARTAMLDWSEADFTGDTIAINLATGSATEWDLVSATTNTVYNLFDVQVDGSDIATGLALNTAISGGAYDGWGFTVEEDTLKFKYLA